MSTATLPLYNRLSSILVGANPVAVYDLAIRNDLADDPIPTVKGLPPTLPTLNVIAGLADFDYYEVPSSWSVAAPSAYYLRRKSGLYMDFPYSMGIPLTYGGAPRLRFKVLSDKIVREEPILAIPSFGLGRGYSKGAKTLEFWMNTEPYSAISVANALPPTIANISGDTNNFTVDSGNAILKTMTVNGVETYVIELIETFGDFTGDFNNEFWTAVTAPAAAAYTSQFTDQFGTLMASSREVITGSPGSPKITFKDHFPVVGGQEYIFSLVVENAGQVSDITVTLNFDDGTTQEIQYVDIPRTSTSIPYSTQFTITPTISTSQTSISIASDHTITISNIKLEQLDAPMEAPSNESIIMEIGGTGGAAIRLSADPFFMYLRGYGQVDNYQIGEWARPMYIVCVDEKATFDVYVNAFKVLSIRKTDKNVYFDSPTYGNWVVFYGSPLFKYMEFGTIALYEQALHSDIQKYHHFISFGTSYNEVVAESEYNKIYIADGSATNFVSRALFPHTNSFLEGFGTGVQIGNIVSLREYTPFEFTATTIPIIITPVTEQGYSKYYAKFSHSAKFHVDKISAVASNIFITMTTYDFHEGSIFSINIPNTSLFCYFDLSQDPSDQTKHIVTATVTTSDDDEPFVWWTSPVSILKEFTIVLDLDKLGQHFDEDVALLFNNNNLQLEFSDEVHLISIGVATKNIMLINNISITYNEVQGVALIPSVSLLGKINYMVYINEGEVDVASTGYWTVSLPLINFATIVNGVPDLDFLMYFDQLQSPQLVSKLSTQYSTYGEIQTYTDESLWGLVSDFPQGVSSYADAQKYAVDSSVDSEPIPYKQIDVGVDASIPTLGRFEKNPIHTFVSLDSRTRWPFKEYERLKTEYATMSGYIDFNHSPNSVTDTKWEIFDGYAIQIPNDIDLMRYDLRYGIHLTSVSMNTTKPSFNSVELFGISSGTNPINAISSAFGNDIVVGLGDEVGLQQQYSTHFSAVKVPSHMFSRELGFYPHYNTASNTVIPISYYLGATEKLQGLSMYFCWRAETFKTDGDFKELIAKIRYINGTDGTHHYLDMYIITDPDPNYSLQRGNIVFEEEESGDSSRPYVDGIYDGQVEAGRWHLIHLVADGLMVSNRAFAVDNHSIKFIHLNNKAVLNYIASHAQPVTPTSLYASRFGATDSAMFPLEPEVGDDIITSAVTESASVTVLAYDPASLTSGPVPTQIVNVAVTEKI